MTVLLAALLVGGGLAAVAYGIAEQGRSKREALARLLDVELAEPSASAPALAELMEKAGALADRALGGGALVPRLAPLLTHAGWSLRPGELIAAISVGAVAAGALIGLALGIVAGLMAMVLVPLAVLGSLSRRGRKRVTAAEEQLPSVLQLLAGSLESGSSVLHALEIAALEGEQPLASEISRVVTETRVGRPLVDSLERMAERVGSRDLEWTVEAIRIQSQTGGRLADTLRVLADFMRARLEIRGEVRSLSAEARLSAKVLTALPFLVGGYFLAFRRSYLEPLLETGAGHGMLLVAAVGIVVGTVWMRRIVRVEV